MKKTYQRGSVYLDRRRSIWYFRWREDGRRKAEQIGTAAEYPTKASAQRAIEARRLLINKVNQNEPQHVSVNLVAKRYIAEKMPERFSTSRGYRTWLNNYILPRWGELPMQAIKAYEVELWLKSLSLAPKSKVHIRGLLTRLWGLRHALGVCANGTQPDGTRDDQEREQAATRTARPHARRVPSVARCTC